MPDTPTVYALLTLLVAPFVVLAAYGHWFWRVVGWIGIVLIVSVGIGVFIRVIPPRPSDDPTTTPAPTLAPAIPTLSPTPIPPVTPTPTPFESLPTRSPTPAATPLVSDRATVTATPFGSPSPSVRRALPVEDEPAIVPAPTERELYWVEVENHTDHELHFNVLTNGQIVTRPQITPQVRWNDGRRWGERTYSVICYGLSQRFQIVFAPESTGLVPARPLGWTVTGRYFKPRTSGERPPSGFSPKYYFGFNEAGELDLYAVSY